MDRYEVIRYGYNMSALGIRDRIEGRIAPFGFATARIISVVHDRCRRLNSGDFQQDQLAWDPEGYHD